MRMRSIVLYKSKWGATKQYADWIKEAEPRVELESVDKVNIDKISTYKKIVVGSRTYMGEIEAIPFLESNWEKLSNCYVYLYSVGLVPVDDPESKESYEMIPEHIREGLAGYTKLMGRIEEKNLNTVQRIFAERFGDDQSHKLDKTAIEPIVSFLKGFEWKSISTFDV